MSHQDALPGVLVDITVVVVSYLAAKAGIIPGSVLVGVICSMASARVVLGNRKTGAPGSNSAALVLLLAVGAAVHNYLWQKASTS